MPQADANPRLQQNSVGRLATGNSGRGVCLALRANSDPSVGRTDSDRGCGEADSAADTGHRTEGPQRPGQQRTSRGGLKAAKAIVPEIRRDGGGAEPATSDASIRTNPEARARIQAFVERRGAVRRLAA